MKKILLMMILITCSLFCACSSVINGIDIRVEPAEWTYDGEDIMDSIVNDIGDESETWNELYYPYIIFRQTDESKVLLFNNSRIAVIKDYAKSSGKIIDTKAYYPDQFGSLEDEMMLGKSVYFDVSQNGRFTLMGCSIDGQPIYIFDNENNKATKITLSGQKRAFFIDNSLYVCVATSSVGFSGEYTTSFLYDPDSGKVEKTTFTEPEESDIPDLSGYTDLGSISSQSDISKWYGYVSERVITESNNVDPYNVRLYLYNSEDKTYCSDIISLMELIRIDQ